MKQEETISEAHHLIESVFEFGLFGILGALLEEQVAVLGEQFGRLGRRVGLARDGVAVDELAAGLVEAGHEAGVVAEGRHDERVVLFVHVQDGGDVDLGVGVRRLAAAFDGRQALRCDVLLEARPQLRQAL